MAKNSVINSGGVVEIRTNVPDLQGKSKSVADNLRERVRIAHKRIAEASVGIMKASIEGTDAIGSKRLYNSVTTREDEIGSDHFQSILYFKDIDYVNYANYGRRAGKFPPTWKIREWMARKGIPENLLSRIAFGIAAYGTQGKYFIEDALPRIRKKANSIFNDEVSKVKNGD